MKWLTLFALTFTHLINGQESKSNGIQIGENLHMDAFEVANIHWIEYLQISSKDSSNEFIINNLPLESITKNYRPDYYSNPAFRYHPVVGITYAQAMNYCKWRTNVVNSKLRASGANLTVKYRLPTEAEWEIAAKKIDSLKMIKPEKTIAESLIHGNRKLLREFFPGREIDIKALKKEVALYSKNKVTNYVLDYEKPWFITVEEKLPQQMFFRSESDNNKNEFHHLIGNVAEMVQEPGVTKGGSWRHILATSFPSKRIFIDPKKSYDWVGFRCVAEVKVN